MNRLILIIILIPLLGGCIANTKKEPSQQFPIKLYVIINNVIQEKAKYFESKDTKYIGAFTINSDGTYTYSQKRFQEDPIYAFTVYDIFYKTLEKKEPCILITYHNKKPKRTNSDIRIEKGGQEIYGEGKPTFRGHWTKTTKTYFPSSDFFKCLYQTGHFIDPKVGELYEKNDWHEEQKPYELTDALLVDDIEAFVSRELEKSIRK